MFHKIINVYNLVKDTLTMNKHVLMNVQSIKLVFTILDIVWIFVHLRRLMLMIINSANHNHDKIIFYLKTVVNTIKKVYLHV